jgi:hypothetical protein
MEAAFFPGLRLMGTVSQLLQSKSIVQLYF